ARRYEVRRQQRTAKNGCPTCRETKGTIFRELLGICDVVPVQKKMAGFRTQTVGTPQTGGKPGTMKARRQQRTARNGCPTCSDRLVLAEVASRQLDRKSTRLNSSHIVIS